MNPETALKNTLMQKLKAAYPAAFFFRTGAGPFGLAGLPDILGVCYGLFIGIEAKRPGKYKEPLKGCTPAQVFVGRRIQDAGGIWFATDDEQHCIATLQHAISRLREKPGSK